MLHSVWFGGSFISHMYMSPSEQRPVSVHLPHPSVYTPPPPVVPLSNAVHVIRRSHRCCHLHPYLCCAVRNAIVLTPAVCVYMGESCWFRVIAYTPAPTRPCLLTLCAVCLQASGALCTAGELSLPIWAIWHTGLPRIDSQTSTGCRWYTHGQSHLPVQAFNLIISGANRKCIIQHHVCVFCVCLLFLPHWITSVEPPQQWNITHTLQAVTVWQAFRRTPETNPHNVFPRDTELKCLPPYNQGEGKSPTFKEQSNHSSP